MRYKMKNGATMYVNDDAMLRIADAADDAAFGLRGQRRERRIKLAVTTRASRRPWTRYRTPHGHAMYARARAVSAYLELHRHRGCL